jgi:DNA-binding GntR family transcriptional regulator
MDATSRSGVRDENGMVQPRVHRIPSLKDAAAEEIRRRVFAAELPPGSKIDQESLARELGISRVPVREALITLHDEGIIVNVARRGAFVAPLSRADVHDHYHLIGVVSGLAAERAATSMTAAELDALVSLAARLERTESVEEEERLNFEFHRLINRASRSRRLLSVLGMLINAIPGTFYESHSEWSEQAHQDHRDTIDALSARDGARARRSIEEHFLAAADRAVTYLEARNFWNEPPGL